MAITLEGPVGLRNLQTPVTSLNRDQVKVINLLMAIDSANGGLSDVVGPAPLIAGSDGDCPLPLATVIWNFQGRWQSAGLTQDGVVDPNGKTLKQLNTLATASGPITVRQFSPPELTAPHLVNNPVISPVVIGGDKYSQIPLETTLHEFLFQVQKGSSIFWVGAAVPFGTVDFTRAQVYFHPTVVQAGTVHAADTDYQDFKGGWSGSIQRYVAMEGGQLAGARLMPLLVPFTTMAALNHTPDVNMFSDRPLETLQSVMDAIQDELLPMAMEYQQLAAIGVSSFSSGISAMRLFITDLSPSGLIKEVTDFDSPFIINEPKALTPCPGATSRCYTQHVVSNPVPGWVNLPAANFSLITAFQGNVHACIGFMMYYTAMLASVIL